MSKTSAFKKCVRLFDFRSQYDGITDKKQSFLFCIYLFETRYRSSIANWELLRSMLELFPRHMVLVLLSSSNKTAFYLGASLNTILIGTNSTNVEKNFLS